jgi:hypothetical protein
MAFPGYQGANQPDGFKPRGRALLQQAGTAEQWIKEGKQTAALTRLSCHRFRANEVRPWLSLIAYNLGICGDGWRCRRLGSGR